LGEVVVRSNIWKPTQRVEENEKKKNSNKFQIKEHDKCLETNSKEMKITRIS
jgi:hypothetical protein